MTLLDSSYRYESTHSKYVEKLPAQYQRSGPILLVVALWWCAHSLQQRINIHRQHLSALDLSSILI